MLSLLREGKFIQNETPKQAAQRSCGCPIPRSAQDQVGWGFGQPGLVGGVPAMAGGWNKVISKVPSNPNHLVILWSFEIYFLGVSNNG